MENSVREKFKAVRDILEETPPRDMLIVSHADHDGFTADILLDIVAESLHREGIPKLHPGRNLSYQEILRRVKLRRPAVLLIVDALLHKHTKKLREIARNTIVVNLDHHEDFTLPGENYIDLNPHSWGEEYLNSSGLIWSIVRPFDRGFFDEIAWLPAVGAVQDYCIEGNIDLLERVMRIGLLEGVDLEAALRSPLLRMAKAINEGIRLWGPREVYEILYLIANRGDVEELFGNERLKEAYRVFERKMRAFRENVALRFEEEVNGYRVRLFEADGAPSYFSTMVERESKRKDIYVGKLGDLLVFRSLFSGYDVRNLGRAFGGGGPHPRVAGGRSRLSIQEVWKKILEIMEGKGQRGIEEFF